MNSFQKILLVSFFSILGIYFAFTGEDIDIVIHHLKEVDLFGIFIASSLLILSCGIRAYRWRLLLEPFEVVPMHRVFSATMVGYFGNGVLAFRLGELLKAYSVSSRRNITVSQAFGTVVLERILDMLMVIFVFVLFLPWFPFQDSKIRLGAYFFLGATFFIIIVLIVISKFELVEKISEFGMFKAKLGQEIILIISKFYEGIMIIRKTDRTISIALSSFLLWGLYYFITWLILKSCSVSLNFNEIGILFVLGSLALGLPALPGSIGTYDAAVKYTLMIIFAINGPDALTYALVSHAVSYFPLVIIGAVYFMLSSMRFKDIIPAKLT